MFKEMAAVESAEPMLVRREVRGDPVQNHANLVLMQLINQVHQILRRAIVAGRSEVSGRLVAPGPKKGMIHQWQEFYVREP